MRPRFAWGSYPRALVSSLTFDSFLYRHIYFDDQWSPHLESAKEYTPSVHIPFGCAGDCPDA